MWDPRRARGAGVAMAYIAATIFAVAQPTRAQDERTTAMARALFQQGVELADHEQWADARDRFERAFALRAMPVIAFNLATACVHLGRFVEAVERFEEVRRDPSSPADARASSQQQLAALRPRLAQLTVRVTGTRAGATLRLDDRELPDALIGVEAPADPGHHTLIAARDGTEVARSEMDVAEGRSGLVTLEVPPPATPTPTDVAHTVVPPATDAAPAPTRSSSLTESPWLWLGIGVGVAVIAAVVIAVVIAGSGLAPPLPNTDPGTLRW